MATLADLAGIGAAAQPANERDDYLAYAEACMVNGKAPLPYPKWIAAGKPAK